jgi:hypothetical protein
MFASWIVAIFTIIFFIDDIFSHQIRSEKKILNNENLLFIYFLTIYEI